MSSPQIVFADLDGTLIAGTAGIGHGVIELLRTVSSSGGIVVPISARPVTNIATLFRCSPHVSYIVGSGGAVIARLQPDTDFVMVDEKTITLSDGLRVIEMLDHHTTAMTNLVFWFKSAADHFEVNIVGDRAALPAAAISEIVGARPMRWTSGIDPEDKALGISLLVRGNADDLVTVAASVEALVPAWRATTYPEYRLTGWSWLEIFSKPANKVNACLDVRELWMAERQTEPEPITIALGDSRDDVEMMRVASRSYCPATASADAQAVATEVINQPGGEPFAVAVTRYLRAMPSD